MSGKKNAKQEITPEKPITPILSTSSTTAILNMNATTRSIESKLTSETADRLDLYIRTKGKRKETFVVGFSKPDTQDETKQLLKKFRTKYACIAAFTDDTQYGNDVLKLSGDVRNDIATYLSKKYGYDEANITIHGYHVKEVKKYVAETDGYERVRIEYQALNDATSEVNNQREIIHLYYNKNKVVETGYWLR